MDELRAQGYAFIPDQCPFKFTRYNIICRDLGTQLKEAFMDARAVTVGCCKVTCHCVRRCRAGLHQGQRLVARVRRWL